MTSLSLSVHEQAMLAGDRGTAQASAMRVVTRMAEVMGTRRLIPIGSAHIDGCMFHGDAGMLFAEQLVAEGAKVAVTATLNVGSLDLLRPTNVHVDPEVFQKARRIMQAYEDLGCTPTWTCAPYQAGHRPAVGEQVAWGESNAVVFCNSVLGARTNRYGDFLDICCAIAGRAPLVGLHLEENRRATVLIDTDAINPALKETDAFYPVLGAWLGATVGAKVAVIDGLPANTSEDRLKALGAASASTGAVALFHAAGLTPEAPDVQSALGGEDPAEIIKVTPADLRAARDKLSTTDSEEIESVALGSPHFSEAEFDDLLALGAGKSFKVPFYVCTGRHAIDALEADGRRAKLDDMGVTIVADTCVVVTPVLTRPDGVLMTNSGKFAHYTPGQTGWQVIYGSLADCVASAETGKLVRDEALWQ